MRDIAKMKDNAENFRPGAQQTVWVQKSEPLAPSARPRRPAKQLVAIISSLIMLALIAAPATASQLKQLPDKQKAELKKNFQTALAKRKGPFGKNVCVCSDGRKEPVLRPDGSIQNVCGDKTQFCSAFRAPWAAAARIEVRSSAKAERRRSVPPPASGVGSASAITARRMPAARMASTQGGVLP